MPRTLEVTQLAIPAEHRDQSAAEHHVQAATRRRLRRHPQHLDRPPGALQVGVPERLEHEVAPDQLCGALTDHDLSRLGQRLEPGGDVGRLPDREHVGAERRAGPADHLADDDEPGVQSDPGRELFDAELLGQRRHGSADSQCGAHSICCVVLMSRGIAEVGQDAVAEILRHGPVERRDDLEAARLVALDHPTHVLGIQVRGQGRRADQVAEHDGEVAPLAGALGPFRCQRGRGSSGLREPLSARLAEEVVRRVGVATARAAPRERRAAPPAVLRALTRDAAAHRAGRWISHACHPPRLMVPDARVLTHSAKSVGGCCARWSPLRGHPGALTPLIRSTISRPMARAAVAAGEGALRT